MSAVMRAFGVPATVTRPGLAPITTTVAWVNDQTDGMPGGMDLQRSEHLKLMAISLSDVPTVPKKTVIVAPEIKGGANKNWQVDSTVGRKFDEVRVLVLEV